MRVIPSIIAGSAFAGALVGLFNAASPAPHGGIFVIPVMDNWFGFLIAIAAGAALTAFLLKLLLPEAKMETEEA